MVVWSEHGSGLIRRLQDGHVTTVRALPPPLYDLRLVEAGRGGGACAVRNGGCAELCLGGAGCACADGRLPAGGAPEQCAPAPLPPPPQPCATDNKFHCGHGLVYYSFVVLFNIV